MGLARQEAATRGAELLLNFVHHYGSGSIQMEDKIRTIEYRQTKSRTDAIE